MPNLLYKNKIQKSTGEVLIDLTSDTVTADTLLQGETAHDRSGTPIVGTAVMPTVIDYTLDTTPYIYKSSEHDAVYDELVGGSVTWNQLVANSGSSLSVTITSGHKYAMKKSGTLSVGASSGSAITGLTGGTDWITDLTLMFGGTTIADYVYTLEQSTAGSGIAWLKSYGFFTEDYYAYNAGGLVSVNTSGKKVVGKNHFFGSIENGVIYGNGTEVSDNPARCKSMSYIPVLPNTTYTFSLSNNTSGVMAFYAVYYDFNKRFVGFYDHAPLNNFTTPSNATYVRFDFWKNNNNLTPADVGDVQLELGSTATNYEPYTSITYPIQSTDLRGLYKLNGTKLYTDGDIYSADGTVTRKYGYRDYQSGDESLANAITDGTHTIYKLSAPTTENAQPFASPQMVYRNGTEEYLDTRDVPIPVGGNRKYVDIPDWMVNEYFDDVRTVSDKQQAQIDKALEQTGYNLVKITATTQTVNGITFTIDQKEGTITVNGTATAVTSIPLSEALLNILERGKSYYMTGCPVGGSYSSKYALYVALDGNTVWRDEGSGEQYSIPQSGSLSALRLLIRSGVAVNNLVFKPMIVPAELAGVPFQPYSEPNYQLTQKVEDITQKVEDITQKVEDISDYLYISAYNAESVITIDNTSDFTLDAFTKYSGLDVMTKFAFLRIASQSATQYLRAMINVKTASSGTAIDVAFTDGTTLYNFNWNMRSGTLEAPTITAKTLSFA